jgi:hypothetical protein
MPDLKGLGNLEGPNIWENGVIKDIRQGPGSEELEERRYEQRRLFNFRVP